MLPILNAHVNHIDIDTSGGWPIPFNTCTIHTRAKPFQYNSNICS